MLHIIILIFHVLGAGFLFSVSIFSLLITAKKTVSKERLQVMMLVEKLAPIAVLNQLITGIYLYTEKGSILLENPVFIGKMFLFILSGILAGSIIKKKRMKIMKKSGNTVTIGNLPLLFFIESLLIITIIVCGVILIETP